MIRELNLFGVYVAPFMGDFFVAAFVFFPLRWLCARSGLLSRVWHAALFELCLFVGALSLVVYL
jgi:protein AaeX